MFPILNPPPSSFPIPSLWVDSVHQPQASSIVHRTWTGDSFHIWYYMYFNAILPNHPTLSLSHRVQKTVLYISVSFAVSYTGLLLPWRVKKRRELDIPWLFCSRTTYSCIKWTHKIEWLKEWRIFLASSNECVSPSSYRSTCQDKLNQF